MKPSPRVINLILSLILLTLLVVIGYLLAEQYVQEEPVAQQDVSDEPIINEPMETPSILSNAQFEELNEVSETEVNGVMIAKSEGYITNPTTGDTQSIAVFTPKLNGLLPVITLVPGGAGSQATFERIISPNTNYSYAEAFAAEGFVTVIYSPLGTGASEGEVNYQGYDDQDGLAYIIAASKDLPNVDEQNIGLVSYSYGVTGATGALARYPELNVKFYSDWEGPSSRDYITIGCRGAAEPDIVSPANQDCDDASIWEEREAATFIQSAHVDYYWRIQQEFDHVQPTYGHTIEMLEGAVGNIPWVRVNDGEINTLYTEETLPIANDKVNHHLVLVIPHVIEMSKMDAITP